jgi:ribokinase
MTEIAVVGSINMDISVPVGSIPIPGETVLGGDALWSGGGKGANQAVAAARLGREVAMVGCVGSDAAGSDLLKRLQKDGIDISDVSILDGVASGLALIAVDTNIGENSIVVSPGANAQLTPGLVAQCSALASAKVVLLQLEVPVGAVAAAAVAANGIVILNPAPAHPASHQLLSGVDVVVPNEHELAAMAETGPLDNADQLLAAATSLDGDADVVVTLGSAGALVVPRRRPAGHFFLEAQKVTAVDTTAAGDSFCGALADALARDENLRSAVEWAIRVAALTVQSHGAQDSLPYLSDFS